MSITLYDHQKEMVNKALPILKAHKIVMLAGEVRTGKTLAALTLANRLDPTKVLFVTKKKAIKSIQADYIALNPVYYLQVINYESLHKVYIDPEIVIVDESHSVGAFPKPSKRYKDLKPICKGKYIILMSGTPSPESYSQLFHQFNLSENSPWSQYANFYKWVNDGYVSKYKIKVNGYDINRYDRANKAKIDADIQKLIISVSQEQAGFTQFVDERFLTVPLTPEQQRIYTELENNGVSYLGDLFAVSANGGDLINKLCQVSSGTIILQDLAENQYYHTIAIVKAEFIKLTFHGKKIAIIYRYKQEFEILKKHFPYHTTSPEEFNQLSDITFLGQVQSTREGVNLSSADAVVMYNLDFSATSYFQIRARMQTKDRSKPALLYWVFSDNGIEKMIYKAVSKKKNFTASYYKKEKPKKIKTEQSKISIDEAMKLL